MENDYSVYDHITPDGMHYYGTTNNIKRRWGYNGIYYKGTALQPYIEKYGWQNIQHIVLFETLSKEDALSIEDFLITTAQEDGVCINKKRSGYVSKEENYDHQYYEQNKDKKKEQKKQYREQNRDKISNYQRDYREQNKDKIREQRKQYREQNKDKIREQRKQYYEQNRDKIKEQKKQYREQNRDKISNYQREYQREYYQKNREKKLEQRRQRYQRKKEEKQFKELGCLPLF